ncbi:serine-enriched protein-like protein, partial [Dinothrombium tinctorium]
MNAADYYGLEELRKACMGFVSCCITVDTVCALLASAERYIQYKCTKSLVQ